jgi:hypothetical protein
MHYQLRLSCFLLIAVFFITCRDKATMPGRAFEGRIVQSISIDASALASKTDSANTPSPFKMPLNMSATITMYVRGDKVACDMGVMGGLISFHSIIDRNARTMTMLMNKHAYVTNLRSLDTMTRKVNDSINAHPDILDSLDKITPKPTGMRKTINGLDCEEYIGTFMGMNTEMWITQDPRLKFYDVIQDAFLGRKRTGEGGLEEMMALMKPISGEGKVPVQMTIMKDGKTFIKSELKEMSEEKVKDEIFEIPKDYEVIKN